MTETVVITRTLWDHPVEYHVTAKEDRFSGYGMDPDMADSIARDICNGLYQCFHVRVDLIICGVTLGTDHLGQCIYRSLNEFISSPGYFGDMINNCNTYAMYNIAAIKEISPPEM